MPSKKEHIEDIYPLSPLQQGMLFDSLRGLGPGIYLEQLVWSVDPRADENLLRTAWQRVIERHTVLRTAFAWDDLEEPLQLVFRRVQLPWCQIDLSRLASRPQQRLLPSLLKEDRRRGFDLKRPPLMRLTLVRLPGGSTKLVWSLHHLLLDGWSAQLVLRDAEAIYQCLSQGRSVDLDPAPPYRDYIAWIRRQDTSEARRFWEGRMGGFKTPTDLPGDPSALDALPGEEERSRSLDAGISAELRALARRRRTTLNTVVMAAWSVLLRCCSGGQEVAFGAIVTSRPAELPGSQRMAGLLINTLPMRIRINLRQPFAALLQELHDLQVEVRRYDYSSLAEIQQWSGIPRSVALFRSLYAFENLPGQPTAQSEGLLRQEALQRVATGYPLSLAVHPFERITLIICYQRQRFEPSTAERMLAQLEALLKQIAAAPEQHLEAFSLPALPEGTRRPVQKQKAAPSELPLPEPDEPQLEAALRSHAERRVANVWKELLHLDRVGAEENFFDLGGHSLMALRLQGKLKRLFSRDLTVADVFAYPTVRSQAAFLSSKDSLETRTREGTQRQEQKKTQHSLKSAIADPANGWPKDAMAVVGMACRFPGAANPDEFWRNLCEGVESVSFFSDEELLESGLDPELLANPRYVKARAILKGIELFEADFFGFRPSEAALTDPQQRIFLECVWEGLENAGCDSRRFNGRIGLFAGSGSNSYLPNNILPNRELAREAGEFQLAIHNEKDYLCTQASYRLNLKGPSINVNTACSTSLVAIHMACRSLADHQCDLAAAGGVTILVPQKRGYLFQAGGIASPDGHCRPFDSRAAGTVGGNGAGVVILKRLSDALKGNDFIHAVIRGSAVNNDGSLKVGFTAPGRDGQAEVIAEALQMAQAPAESIGLVEAHGTGTELGDPVEVDALTQAFRRCTSKQGFCRLGSVKSNLGHLDAAAGVAGLIKAVLALRHRRLPPSLHFESPNPRIDFAETPFRVNQRLAAWENGSAAPRRAGVSSFGIGGTNAHVVLQEAPPVPEASPSRQHQLIVLAARSPDALQQLSSNLSACLKDRPEVDLHRTAYTLQAGRRHFSCRRFLISSDRQEAIKALAGQGAKPPEAVVDEGSSPAVAFLFPGQGLELKGMGSQIYASQPAFRDPVDRCAEILKPHLGKDLREILYPADQAEQAAQLLEQPRFAQPALFTIEYALAALWTAWGIRPQAMIGHSLGEYAAACLAGVFRLQDALEVVALRGELMQGLPGGSMMAVALDEQQIRPLLAGESLALAAVNEPGRCIVSGADEEIEGLQRRLQEQGAAWRKLPVSRAFHSPMMDPVLQEFESRLCGCRLRPPQLPFVSNLSGDWIRSQEATQPGYWVRHMRQTVLFAKGVARLMSSGCLLLEVGPGRSLTSAALKHPQKPASQIALPSLPGNPAGVDEEAHLLRALGRLWLSGVEVDWDGFHGGRPPGRVPLPSYPFQRQRHWVDPPQKRQPESRLASAEIGQPDGLQESTPEPIPEVACSPRKGICAGLKEIFARLLGVAPEQVGDDAPFVELGADSLLLLQASHQIQDRYGVEIPFRQMMGEAATLAALSDVLAAWLPSEPTQEEASPVPVQPSQEEAPEGLETVQDLMNRQVQAMSDLLSAQLEALKKIGAQPSPHAGQSPMEEDSASIPEAGPEAGQTRPAPYIPYQPVRAGSLELSQAQRSHLDALIDSLGKRTRQSKRIAEQSRSVLADSRASAGFRTLWKEVLYPIVVERASGSRVWDVDGNEYLDISMGFGSLLFGHSPPFLVEALEQQLQSGLQIGLQSPLAGKAARIISRLTGAERVTFLNSGTEAVAAAVRLARTATGRTKIAFFTGSYHGFFDEALVRSAASPDGTKRSVPMAPGIPSHVSDSVLVLDYCRAESLQQIRHQAGDLAAVLVEPQQSRLPGEHDAGEFLGQLRQLTLQSGIALIFDEVITGFRVHPGGAQALYGIQADMAVYGKAAGGGVPVGIVAGKRRFLDAIDGGEWNYGDQSYPQATTTFIAGTYFKHPLNMAGIWAALDHLEKNSPALQEDLNRKTQRLCRQLDEFFRQQGLPIRTMRFGSLFRFAFPPHLRHADLFYYHLLERGIYVWEGRGFFLSTAHSEEDLARIAEAVREAALALQRGGFLPASSPPSQPVSLKRLSADSQVKAFPPTAAQQELWSLAQMGAEASRAYNEAIAFRMLGPFRPDAMQAALQQVVDRHEVLRAWFDPQGGLLRIASRARADVPLIDLSGLGAGLRSKQRKALLEREAQRAFDLGRPPLFRMTVLRLQDEEHWLGGVFHHSVTDGISNSLLLRELAALYSAACMQEPCSLPDATPFSEFAAWQSRHVEGERLQRAEAFWLGQFSPPPPPLQLPLDRPRPPVQSFEGVLTTRTAGPTLTRRLRETAARTRTSLFSLVLTAFQILLHRLSGQSDLAVGVVSAGQAAMGAAALVGYCVNLLAIRSSTRGDPSLTHFLQQASSRLLDSAEQQSYPFSRLVRKLGLRPDPARPPLVSALLNMERRAAEGLEFYGLQAEPIVPASRSAKSDLELEAALLSDRLELALTTNTHLFEKATAQRWLEHLLLLLEEVCRPDIQRLSQLAWLSPAQAHQLCTEWRSGAGQEKLAAACLHDAALEQAKQKPEALAAILGDQHLSYGEMFSQAKCLAGRLQQRGALPGEPVGICLRGSLQSLVAVMGVSLSGACFLKLDRELPHDRLDFLVTDSGLRFVVADLDLPPDFPSAHRIDSLRLEIDRPSATGPQLAPNPAALPEGPAYIIYTSGSTGRPKGVVVPHAAACRHFEDIQRLADLNPRDRVLQFYSLSFDASLDQIFPTLAEGCCLVLRGDQLWDGDQLTAVLGLQAVTVADFPTSYWGEVAGIAGQLGRLCPALRQISVGGEEMPFRMLRAWQQSLPGNLRLLHLYGPTEAVIAATGTDVTRSDMWSVRRERAPIGRPLAGNQVLILDRWGQPVPVGVGGQIYLGGLLLAHGYWGLAAQTAHSFLPDPFSARPGARLYKTGDLGCFRPDGMVEFLGRCDRQIKLRGFRIELDEIEAVLGQHPQLKACTVMLRTDIPDRPCLTAYYVAGAPLTAVDLRRFLRERLPGYMVPEACLEIPSLPLTTGGKVDRRALPAPDLLRESGQAGRAPRTATERRLTHIWADLLGLGKADADTDFFESGGHSLLLARAVNRVGQEFGCSLKLGDLLQAPTPALLAQRIESRLSGRGTDSDAAPELELEKEAFLEASIQPRSGPEPIERQPEGVFLTGSTGFLGAFLLDQLLQTGDAEIFCLVRAEGIQAGEAKIRRNLEKYGLCSRWAEGRVQTIPGDLAKPLLGLGKERFQGLSEKIGTIFHNGAAVNFVLPYSSLKAPNVQGTYEVIRLACQTRPKVLHHISTLSVFSEAQGSRLIREGDRPDSPQSLTGGYAQSKRIAEELVRQVAKRGLSAAVYRLGGIGGDSRTGAYNNDDLLVRLIKGCLQMGCAPDVEFRIEVTPADFMAQAIVYLSRQPGSTGNCYHLTNPHPLRWQEALDWIRNFGYPIQILPYPDWLERLKGETANALTPLLTLFTDWDPQSAQQVRLDFDCTRALKGLSNLDAPWPPVDSGLLETYFEHWISSGFLKPPGQKSRSEEKLVGLKRTVG